MRMRKKWVDVPLWFRSEAAFDVGVTGYALAHESRYTQIHRGVWLDSERSARRLLLPAWVDAAWVDLAVRAFAACVLVPGAKVCGSTAAQLYGLPVPEPDSQIIHLAIEDRHRRCRRSTISLHRMASARTVEWCELPLISAVDLFVELGSQLTLDQLVRLGDAIVGNFHGPPLCTLEELRADVSARPYLHSRQIITRALALIREDVDSPKETDLRLWFRNRGLPEPTIHPAVYCEMLGWVVHPDLGYPDVRVAIEYQGDQHRTSAKQWSADLDRRAALEAEGWTVVEVTNLSRMDLVERRIRQILGLTAARADRERP